MRASCALARVEVSRAVRPHGLAATVRATELLARLDVLALDGELLDAAASLDPSVLCGLDAIHLAAAATFGDDLHAVVTYNARMQAGAPLLALRVEAPV